MEKVIGSLVGVSGHTFDIVYDLFFTTERVIAVLIQHPVDTPPQFTSAWKTMFLGSGRAIRKEKLERKKTAQAQRLSSQSLTPDEMVTANPRNFAIRYHEITSVEIACQLFQSQLRFHVSVPSTIERVIRFNLTKKQVPEAQHLLELALPSKTKGK